MSNYGSTRLLQQIITVNNSAVKLPAAPLDGRRIIVVQNLSTNPVYLGYSTVTTSGSTRGIVLARQYDSFTVNLRQNVDLWGIAGSASDVAIMEIS